MIITKEREERNRKAITNKGEGVKDEHAEFPKLLLEQEGMGRNEQEETKRLPFSQTEMIMFMLYCASFIIVIYLQLSISKSFAINEAVKNSILQPNPTILSKINGTFIDYTQIYVADDYWSWLNQLIASLDNKQYYAGYDIPQDKLHSIPNLNVLQSSLRFTQRRMQLKRNTDPYTSRYVPSGWPSQGFDYLDSYDSSQEDKTAFGTLGNQTEMYQYNIDQSFYQEGGFVYKLDLIKKNEFALQNLTDLRQSGFIDKQTRSIVLDFVLFNEQIGFYIMVTFVAIFGANGLLTTDMQLYNMKRFYYLGISGLIRLICEAIFAILLFIYIMIEYNQITAKIRQQRIQWEKQVKQKIQQERVMQNEKRQKGGEENKIAKNNQKLSEGDDDDEELGGSSKVSYGYLQGAKFVLFGLKEHYSDGWSGLNFVFLFISTVALFLWVSVIYVHETQIAPLTPSDLQDIKKSEIFFVIAFRIKKYRQMCGINFVLIFIKLLRYLASIFERAQIIFKTLAYAQASIFYFLIMYMVIFFAFVVMVHIFYGSQLKDFNTITSSLETLFMMLMGNLSYLDEMITISSSLSFFFFIAFITSMNFILMNMFIAFISMAYSEANVQIDQGRNIQDILNQKHWTVRLMELKVWFRIRYESIKACFKPNPKAQLEIKKQTQEGLLYDQADTEQPVDHTAMAKKVVLMNIIQSRLNFKDQVNKQVNDVKPQEQLEIKYNEHPSQLRRATNLFSSEFQKNRAESYKINIENNQKEQETKPATVHSNETSQTEQNNNRLKAIEEDKEELAAEERKLKAKQKLEYDKAQSTLMTLEWDKNFDEKQFAIDEPQWAPTLTSERQELESMKEREIKCGQLLWSSISFLIYAGLYIVIIQMQITVSRNYNYNSAMQNIVTGLNPPGNDDFTVQSLNVYSELIEWLTVIFPTIGTEQPLNYDPSYNLTGFYIQEENYVLNNSFRLCFTLSAIFDTDQASSDQLTAMKNGGPARTQDFIGLSSGYTWTYISGMNGFQRDGSYCRQIPFIPTQNFTDAMNDFISDRIVNDSLLTLGIEFVTLEASSDVHVYNGLKFIFPDDGTIKFSLQVYTLRFNMYQFTIDYIRLGLEVIYVFALFYNIYIFISMLKQRSRQYNGWHSLEIDTLSEVEKRQRGQKSPELFRKWDAVVQAYTFLDMLYFTCAITSMCIWIFYITVGPILNQPLTPISDLQQQILADRSQQNEDETNIIQPPAVINWNDYYSNIYFAVNLLASHAQVVAFNTIFLSIKVFSYFNNTKRMQLLSNTLYKARIDTMFFILIFLVLMFGFVLMAYVSFGNNIVDYSDIGSAMRMCFAIILGQFDYGQLKSIDSTITPFFFFPFNIMFVFILQNIFLAIINQTYQEARNTANLQALNNEEPDVDISASVCFCFKMVEHQAEKRKAAARRVSKSQEKVQKEGDYLEGIEKVSLQMGRTNPDEDNDIVNPSELKTWAINCADEIKTELKMRTHLRHQSREPLVNKVRLGTSNNQGGLAVLMKGEGGKNLNKTMDDMELLQRRLDYWDYLRTVLQFISMQNKVINQFLSEKQQEIFTNAVIYKKEKEQTDEMYKYVAIMEHPVEEKLKQILHLRKYLSLLRNERTNLKSLHDSVTMQKNRLNQQANAANEENTQRKTTNKKGSEKQSTALNHER